MRILLLAASCVATLSAGPPPADGIPVYGIDASRSTVQFTITKLGVADVVGTFGDSTGEIRWHASEPDASTIHWRVRVRSVRTDEPDRDGSLQAREYFDAANHPELVFESDRARALDAARLEVSGRLTLRGVTRPLTVVVRRSGSLEAPVFETDFEVDRYEFGIAGGPVMGRLIGRRARVHLRAVTTGRIR
jgi:polyisoprenoid-binding protein YceI